MSFARLVPMKGNKEVLEAINGFKKRYIHTHDKKAMRQLARDWLKFLKWELRANASTDTLMKALLIECMNKTYTLIAMDE